MSNITASPEEGALSVSRRSALSVTGAGLAATLAGLATGVRPSQPTVADAKRLAEDRARYHYAEFAKAMGEITGSSHGWRLIGGQLKEYSTLRSGAWANLVSVEYVSNTEPQCPSLIVERHRELSILTGATASET